MPITGDTPRTASTSREERVYVRNVHAPHAVRRFVRAILGTWNLDHLADNTEVVATELATNAVQNANGDTVAVRIERLASAVRVNIWDDNPELPSEPSPDVDDEHGRGLMITAALSTDFGFYPVTNGGKVVWAVIK